MKLDAFYEYIRNATEEGSWVYFVDFDVQVRPWFVKFDGYSVATGTYHYENLKDAINFGKRVENIIDGSHIVLEPGAFQHLGSPHYIGKFV